MIDRQGRSSTQGKRFPVEGGVATPLAHRYLEKLKLTVFSNGSGPRKLVRKGILQHSSRVVVCLEISVRRGLISGVHQRNSE
jgi:hypothetical protein